jgi:hypothetical protein
MDVTFMGAENKLAGQVPLWRYRYRSVLAVLLLPGLLLIGVFSYYPAVRSLIGGFYQWNGFSAPTYTGISQFREYVQSPTFGTEAKNLGILVGGSILISLVSQFTAAEVVTHMPRRSAAVAKYVLVLPIVLPPLVLIEVWAYLLQPGSGLVDRVFGAVGLPQPTWFSDPHLALAGILLVGFPWIANLGFLIFLGGLQNLPRDILDAGHDAVVAVHGRPRRDHDLGTPGRLDRRATPACAATAGIGLWFWTPSNQPASRGPRAASIAARTCRSSRTHEAHTIMTRPTPRRSSSGGGRRADLRGESDWVALRRGAAEHAGSHFWLPRACAGSAIGTS